MDASNERSQYLTFQLAGEEYAVRILEVREIIEFGEVTRVPGTPAFVRGVTNLRGRVVPVIDLAVKFGLSETPVTRRTCIVLVDVSFEGAPALMGLLAASVNQVLELAPTDIEPPPSFGTLVRPDFLVGLGRSGARFVLLLDVPRVLSSAELIAVQAVQAVQEAPREEPAPGPA